MMRILIRDQAFRYLVEYYEWSFDDRSAMAFTSTEQAERYCQRNFLRDVQLVLKFHRAPDIILMFETASPL